MTKNSQGAKEIRFNKRKNAAKYPTNLNVHAVFPIRFRKNRKFQYRSQDVQSSSYLQKQDYQCYHRLVAVGKLPKIRENNLLLTELSAYANLRRGVGYSNGKQALSPILTVHKSTSDTLLLSPKLFSSKLLQKDTIYPPKHHFSSFQSLSASTDMSMTTTEDQYTIYDSDMDNELEKSLDSKKSQRSVWLPSLSNLSLESDEAEKRLLKVLPNSQDVNGTPVNTNHSGPRNESIKKMDKQKNKVIAIRDEKVNLLKEKTQTVSISFNKQQTKLPKLSLKELSEKRNKKSGSSTRSQTMPEIGIARKIEKSNLSSKDQLPTSFHNEYMTLPLRGEMKR